MTDGTEVRGQRSGVDSALPLVAPNPGEAGSTRQRALSSHTQTSTLNPQPSCKVALLTGGGDKPYALGLAAALTAEGISIDFIGSDDLDVPELRKNSRVRFLNLRGDQSSEAGLAAKVLRVAIYYVRLVAYPLSSEAKIFHILWNNKLEFLDRTFLMLFYKLMGKRVVLTAHNVNARKRDNRDSFLNRFSLGIQYKLCNHIFVHTERMRDELLADFAVAADKASVIPFGINNTVPNTILSSSEAKRQLGIEPGDKVLLFFGNIAPYKGLEHLVAAFAEILKKDGSYLLVIAGRSKGSPEYWEAIEGTIASAGLGDRTLQRIEYVPDEETELYFKAADVLILPYTQIFQSGVLFLSYSFGLPVIAADVGPLKEEVVEGQTGFVFKARDSLDLAKVIHRYFGSELFRNLEGHRHEISEYANQQYSWSQVASLTSRVYDKTP
jgi:glycosyltransferase involved in cell wall biosynthesis